MEKIYQLLEKSGHEVYLVGGAVRDMYLGKSPKDMDFSTSAKPDEVINIFKSAGYEVIPTGIDYGTVTVVIDGESYEITTFRAENGYTDGRRPDIVNFSSSIEEDLKRRDLTINAMAFHPIKGLVDPFNGRNDLEKGIIRAVGNPMDRLKEDFLRSLRAVRFAVRFGFSMDESLLNAIQELSWMIKNVSSERIFGETTKIIMDNPSREMFVLLSKLLFPIIPELSAAIEMEQNHPYHTETVGFHTLKVIHSAPKKPELKWAALLHDMGKTATKITESGVDHFYGHAEASVSIAERVLKSLKTSTAFLDEVVFLVKTHDVPLEPTPRAVRKFASKYKVYTVEEMEQVISMKTADALGQHPDFLEEKLSKMDEVYQIFSSMENKDLSIDKLAINGHDLIKMGFKGPEIGRFLRFLLEKVVDSPELNTKEKLIQELDKQLNAV